MHFVVTGTPRSATKYSSKLLTDLGAPCTHEQVMYPSASVLSILRWLDNDDTPGESSWMAWTLPLLPEPIPVLHVIRDPWLVIDSLANRNNILDMDQVKNEAVVKLREVIRAYLPEVFLWPNRADMAATFVLGWNRLIAEACPDRYVFHPDRLDLGTLRGMLDHVGVEHHGKDLIALRDQVSTKINKAYSLNDITQLSDPTVMEALKQYAVDNGFDSISARSIVDRTEYQTPAELAEKLDPDLLDQVNEYATRHGYETVDVLQPV